MKASRILMPVVAAFAAFATFAETLVFAPGNGVTTNVAEQLPAGVDIQANEGTSGGGIVNLLNPLNGSIGTATVKCGTLGVETLRRSGQKGGIGTLSLGNGTFRYMGSTPAATDMNVILSPAGDNDAGVIWCDGDMKTYGTFSAERGALVKAGPGMLTVATAAQEAGTRQVFALSSAGNNWNWIMNMKANGDSPTQAYANLTVREGRFVIDTADDVVTVLGAKANSFDWSGYVMCGCRSGAAAGSEPYGHIDIRSGTVYLNASVLVGYYNGSATSRPDADSGSSFNIYGGTVTGDYAPKIWVGALMNANEAYGGVHSFNVYGGTISKFTEVLIARNRGARARFFLSGTTFETANLKCADYNGGTSADDSIIPIAEVAVSTNGVLSADTINPCVSGFCDFTLKVADGGTLRRDRAMTPTAAYATSPMRLILDGGMLELRGSGYDVVSPGFTTRLGSQQSKIKVTGSGTYTFPCPVVTDNVTDGGLRIGGNAGTTVAFTGGMTIAGPIASDKNVTVKFGADATTGTIIADDADLCLAFGWTGSRFAKLTAEGWNALGTVRITFDGAWTAGTYDLVSLPSGATVDLSHVMLKTASDTTDASFATRTEDGRFILSATLATRSVASYEWTNSAGGTWGDGANWGDGTGSAPAGSGARAVFATAADAAGTAVTLADGLTIGGMSFSASPGYELSGAAITLDNAGGPATIAATSGANEIAASVAMAGETYLNAASGATLAISGAISGYGPLAVNVDGGTGTVALSGANTFATVPFVNAGTLRVTGIANAGTTSSAGVGSAVSVGTAVFEIDGTGATDRTFEMAAATAGGKSALGATAGSTLTVNGAVDVASGTVFAKTGDGAVVLNGVGGYSFPRGIAVDGGTLAICTNATVDPSYGVTVASGAALELDAGATLRSRFISGDGAVLWNGGVWKPVVGISTAWFGASAVQIGAGGVKIDLTEMPDQTPPSLGGVWTGVGSDGGITVSSVRPATNNKLNCIAFAAGATYSFSGPVTLASGGVAKTMGAVLAANSVSVQANGAIAAAMSGSSAEETTVKNLTLAAGSSVFAYISGAGVCATLRAADSLSVGGTVYVALCSGPDNPDVATTAGTYAILRGPKGSLDASKFAMSPRYKAANGTFALDTSAVDYDQITLTLSSATAYNSTTERDFNRDFTWVGGSGAWTDAANWDVGYAPEDSHESRAKTVFPSTVADGTRISLGGQRIMQRLLSETPGELWLTDGTVNPRGNGEFAFMTTTRGTIHLPNVLGDEWRSTFVDVSAGATQVVEGVLSSVNQTTILNRFANPAGVLRIEGGSKSDYLVEKGTLAGRPEVFGAAYRIEVRNCTMAFTSSGDMLAMLNVPNGLNLRVEDGAEVMVLNDLASAGGPFIKTGGGTAILAGAGAVTLGASPRSNEDYSVTEMPEGGTLPSVGLDALEVDAGKLVVGLSDSQRLTVSGRIIIGSNIAEFDENGDVLDAELEILGGTVTAGDLRIGHNAGAYRASHDCGAKKRNLALTVRGGSLTFSNTYTPYDAQGLYNGTASINLYGGIIKTTGAWNNWSHYSASTKELQYGAARTVFNIYGGMFTNTVSTLSTNNGDRNLDINMYGGDFAWTAPFKYDGGAADRSFNVNMHGGTFMAQYVQRNYGSASCNWYWNGGTFRPTLDGALFKPNNSAWNSNIVSTNGAAFDIPGANTFTLNQAFTHDAALGATRDGGIRKRGTGTLLLSAANTFTGPCVAEAGVMRPTIAMAVSGGVGASGSGVFDMNGFGLTVPELVGEGGLVTNGALTVTGRVYTESFVQVDDVVLSGATFASNGENYIKVLSSAEGSIIVDFGRDESDPLPRYYAVKVAEMPSGSHLYVTGVNTGRPGRWEITGERRNEADGMVEIWAVLKPVGTAIILR